MSTPAKVNVRLPKHITPIRYGLEMHPDLEGFLFKGYETIAIQIDKPGKTITLHARELVIDKKTVVVKAGKQVYPATDIDWNDKLETVTFIFAKAIPKGKAILSLTFEGVLNETLRGFYRSKYLHNGKEKFLATTQFESTDARAAFPCFDEPAHKAIFDVSFVLPEHLTVISNMLPAKTVSHEKGKKYVTFAPTPRMSTYLLAFIVGEFEYLEAKSKDGVLVRVFVTPGKKHQAQFALDTAVKCLEFFNTFYGIPYPLDSMDLIGIPDFAAGAMENWGAVTYRESQLLVDPEHSSAVTKQWVGLTIAHELAHQWFGNLVTMEWWTHLWLNEGFASYMEYVAIDHVFPEWDIWKQFVYIDFNSALDLDSLANTHPIEVEVHHPSEIGEIFDAISYHKGASVIRMLAEYLGEKDFKAGLHQYLKKHSYKNAKTEDLWYAFEKASKKPVIKLMNTWIQKAGYPLLTLEVGKNGYSISQQRFFSSSASKNNDKTIWSVPLSITTPEGEVKKLLLDKKITKLDISIDTPWIKLNASETTPVRVAYPPMVLTNLREPITKRVLEPLDRLGVVRDAFSLAESGFVPTDEALDLATAYKAELDYNVWAELSSRLSSVKTLFRDDAWYDKLEVFLRSIYVPLVEVVGFEPKAGERHDRTLLRTLVLGQAGILDDKSVIAWAKKLFTSGKSINPDLRGVVYLLAIRFGGAKEFKTLLARYKLEQMSEERNRMMRALGMTQDFKLIQELLGLLRSSHVRLQDGPTFIGSLFANHIAAPHVWKHLQTNWKHYEKIYGQGGHTFSRILMPLGNFHAKKDLTTVKQFFKTHKAEGAERTVLQIIEQIESNIAWRERDSKIVAQYLGAQGKTK